MLSLLVILLSFFFFRLQLWMNTEMKMSHRNQRVIWSFPWFIVTFLWFVIGFLGWFHHGPLDGLIQGLLSELREVCRFEGRDCDNPFAISFPLLVVITIFQPLILMFQNISFSNLFRRIRKAR